MSASDTAGRTDILRLAFLLCCGFGIALQFGRVPASLPAMRTDLDLTLTQSGWIVSTVSVVAAFGGLFAGILAARLGAVTWVALGLALSILGGGLGWMAADASGLIVARVVEGAGFIMAATGLPPLVVRAAGQARAPVALALWGIYLPVGMALMLAVAPLVIAHAGWRGAIIANMAALTALLAGFIVLARPYRAAATPMQAPPPMSTSLAALRADPNVFRLAAIFTLYAAQFLAVMAFLPLVLREAVGGFAGYATALVVLLNGAGNLIGALGLARGVTSFRLLATGLVMMGLMGALALTGSFPWGVRLAAAAAMSFCGGLVPATLLGGVGHLAMQPSARPAAVGLLLQGAGVGQLAGPPLIAAVVTHYGWNATAGFALGLSALGLVVALGLSGPLGRQGR